MCRAETADAYGVDVSSTGSRTAAPTITSSSSRPYERMRSRPYRSIGVRRSTSRIDDRSRCRHRRDEHRIRHLAYYEVALQRAPPREPALRAGSTRSAQALADVVRTRSTTVRKVSRGPASVVNILRIVESHAGAPDNGSHVRADPRRLLHREVRAATRGPRYTSRSSADLA